MSRLQDLIDKARACQVCAGALAHDPRPVLRAQETARLLIVGQAPGTRVHATGIPWNDPSGDRLRAWMGLDREAFYDESKIAIVPMGLCFPGLDHHGGDLPPRKECATHYHPAFRDALPNLALTLLVGAYAQKHYLGKARGKTMGETVRNFRSYGPAFLPLPHPSWRNTAWLKKNTWFEAEVLPELHTRVALVLKT